MREGHRRGGREGPKGPPAKELSALRGTVPDHDVVQVRSCAFQLQEVELFHLHLNSYTSRLLFSHVP